MWADMAFTEDNESTRLTKPNSALANEDEERGSGGKGCAARVARGTGLAAMCSVGLLIGAGNWSAFSLVMTHLTSANATDQSCPVRNTSRDMEVEVGEDVLFYMHTVYLVALFIFKIPGSVLATRFSPCRVEGYSMVVISVTLMVLPTLIQHNALSLIFILRFVQGAVSSIQDPACSALISVWSTDTDRARLLAVYNAGFYLSPAVVQLLTGVALCYVSWNSAFYILGMTGLVWSGVWLWQFSDTPSEQSCVFDMPNGHPCTQDQRNFFTATQSPTHKKEIPWRSILTSCPVWAIVSVTFARNYMYECLLVGFAQFFTDVYHFDPFMVGFLAMLPNVGTSLVCYMGGMLSDFLLLYLSKTTIRKIMTCSGMEGLCMVTLFLVEDWRLAVASVVTTALGGLAMAGFPPLCHDMAPDLMAALTGVTQSGYVGAVCASLQSALMTRHGNTGHVWQQVFLVAGLVQMASAIFFAFTADAKLQPWSKSYVAITPSTMSP